MRRALDRGQLESPLALGSRRGTLALSTLVYSWFTALTRVVHILFGAGFTLAFAMALGWLALGGLRLRLGRLEVPILAFLTGSAVLSLATFGLCVAGQARPVVFLAAGIAAIGGAAWVRWKTPPSKPPILPKRASCLGWQVLFYVGIGIFGLIYFVNALAPEVSPDGSGYHLGNVLRLWQHHGFAWETQSMYAWFPQGMEMLFLVAYSFGGPSSAALVHAAFLLALPLLMAAFGRRLGFPRAAMGAGLLVFASPVMGIDGASAYNDVALATVGFAVAYCSELSVEEDDRKYLFIIGLLAGFCAAIKYTGGLAVLLAVWWRGRNRRGLWLFAGAALSVGPWFLRNWFWVGNPVAPFFNHWFPNPWYFPGPEASYVADLRHYEAFRQWWQAPVDLAVIGGSVSGIVGPAFLLAPLALVALRHSHGRKLLLAAVLWAIPAWFNSGARFLIPALPFLAMAMGMALENSWGALPALALFELWACWPGTLAAYAAPWSWRIREIPLQAALRRQPEDDFLAAHVPDLAFKAAIDRWVQPGEKIFSYAGRPEAYLDRSIVTGYESSLGLLVQDILAQAVASDAAVQQVWPLDEAAVNAVRVVSQRAGMGDWKVAEIRLWDRSGEVRPGGWTFAASPNRWQALLAFDGSPATRWHTWQPLQPGFWIQVAFRQPLRITRVEVESAAVPDAHPLLEVASPTGRWQRAPEAAAEVTAAVPGDLRQDAMAQLKARGIFYLLLNDSDLPAKDMKEHANLWGVTELEGAHGTRLYRIQ
jgi:hypothetical protein